MTASHVDYCFYIFSPPLFFLLRTPEARLHFFIPLHLPGSKTWQSTSTTLEYQ